MSAATRADRRPLSRLSFSLAGALALALTVYPPLAIGAGGRTTHGALMLSLWGIAAGFVYGVGFTPDHRLLRAALGPWAALPLMAVGSILLVINALR